jgi:hypothetical protein
LLAAEAFICAPLGAESAAYSLGPQNKSSLVATALPIEPFRALFPLPDSPGSEHPKDFGICHCNVPPIGFAPHKLT